MIKSLKEKFGSGTYEQAHETVISYVNETCRNILDNTAVFKKDEKGVRGFKGFLASLDITEV